jgi:hypothetical protein
VRATVRVHDYLDGRLAIFHGPHRLADYDPRGTRATAPNWLRGPLRLSNHLGSGQLMRHEYRST